MKMRKKLVLSAIVSMSGSILGILGLIVLFFKSRPVFALMNERNPDMHFVLFALKALLFLGCPGLCLCLLALGWDVLHYLSKEGKLENPGD